MGLSLAISALLAMGAAPLQAPPPFPVCSGYGCAQRQQVRLAPKQWQAVRAQLTPPSRSAGEERLRVGQAIALMERLVGRVAGTGADLGGNRRGAGGLAGQMDCIDESTNTTTYLELLAAADLLRWHEVEPRARRGLLMFFVHWSAVIRERDTGVRYAVDSWHADNGSPPLLEPLSEWRWP